MIERRLECFTVASSRFQQSNDVRLDAMFYNQKYAQALTVLENCGMDLMTLGELTQDIYMPGRFKRTYLSKEHGTAFVKEHGIPFLQGSQVVHFRPADIKYLSKTAHKNLKSLQIKRGWLLITRSGSVGRVAVVTDEWHNWAASEHIFRIVPKVSSPCPVGYLGAFLMSPLGQIQLNAHAYGAVVDELSVEHIRGIKIPVPSVPEQRELVDRIDELVKRSNGLRSNAVGLAEEAESNVCMLVPSALNDAG